MKKIILLLLFPLMFACSSDKDNEPAIDYIDNNLIEGKWAFVDGIHTTYMIFQDNIMRSETYHTYDGFLINKIPYGNYKLSKDNIYYGKFEVPYTLKDDVFTIIYDSDNKVSYTKVND